MSCDNESNFDRRVRECTYPRESNHALSTAFDSLRAFTRCCVNLHLLLAGTISTTIKAHLYRSSGMRSSAVAGAVMPKP